MLHLSVLRLRGLCLSCRLLLLLTHSHAQVSSELHMHMAKRKQDYGAAEQSTQFSLLDTTRREVAVADGENNLQPALQPALQARLCRGYVNQRRVTVWGTDVRVPASVHMQAMSRHLASRQVSGLCGSLLLMAPRLYSETRDHAPLRLGPCKHTNTCQILAPVFPCPCLGDRCSARPVAELRALLRDLAITCSVESGPDARQGTTNSCRPLVQSLHHSRLQGH